MNTRLITILSNTILFGLVFYIFKSSLGYDFVWDDREVIVNNLNIRTLDFNSIIWAFTNTLGGHYQPLTWSSFIIDFNIWGLESYGFRLTNILIHSFNAVLLMLVINKVIKLFYRLPEDNYGLIISSIFGALIFALHPLRVESVVWITERRDLLSALFILVSFLSYINYRFNTENNKSTVQNKTKLYVISFCSCFLSLLCKAWAISFPVVLVLVDILVFHPKKLSFEIVLDSIKTKAPFIFLSIIFVIIGVSAASNSGAMVSWDKLTFVDRILQASYGSNMYLLHTLYPSGLSPLYLLGKTNFYDIKFYIHLVFFMTMFITAFLIRNKYNWPIYILLIYLVIIFPVLGFSQSGPQIMADRYSYIATMPFYIIVSFVIFRGFKLVLNQKKYVNNIVLLCSILVVFLIIIYALITNTKKQILIWENEETLWTHAINIDSFNYRAISNRADYRLKKKKYNKSIEDYSLVLELDKENAYALNGRASAKIYLGDLNGAIEDLNEALDLAPGNIDVLLNRGVAFHNLGKAELARNDFLEIINNYPEYVKAIFYLAISYFSENEFEKAIILFTKVINIDQQYIESIYYRGLANLYIGNHIKAKNDFESVMSVSHTDTELHKSAEQQLNLLNTSGN
jgi:protein O-mannosyl-transferase